LAWYDELDRHGGEHILVMLMEDDRIAAVCEASWDARFPDRVYQMLTAVARPWRGRGLAKGVKAAMMRLIRDRHPDIRFITTSNANLNAPMLAINAQLGFAEHRRTAIYQIGFSAITEYLARRPAVAGEVS
jgi:GNAT superfamily N-acetyltransferase